MHRVERNLVAQVLLDVEVTEGDIRFSTGKNPKEKKGTGKSPAKSYRKIPKVAKEPKLVGTKD